MTRRVRIRACRCPFTYLRPRGMALTRCTDRLPRRRLDYLEARQRGTMLVPDATAYAAKRKTAAATFPSYRGAPTTPCEVEVVLSAAGPHIAWTQEPMPDHGKRATAEPKGAALMLTQGSRRAWLRGRRLSSSMPSERPGGLAVGRDIPRLPRDA